MAQVPVPDSQTEEEGRANCPMSVGQFCQFPVASSPRLRPMGGRGVQASQNRKGMRMLARLGGQMVSTLRGGSGVLGGVEGPQPAWVPWNPGTPSCSVRARCCPSNPAMPYLPPCSPDSNTLGWLRPRKSPPARDQRTRREGGALAPQSSILANPEAGGRARRGPAASTPRPQGATEGRAARRWRGGELSRLHTSGRGKWSPQDPGDWLSAVRGGGRGPPSFLSPLLQSKLS